jgi:5'(3')-deoxyribonucleotidase
MVYRIAVDMDEVLADTLTKELHVYNREHGTSVAKNDLAGTNLDQAVRAEHRDRVRQYPRTEGFFRDIPVMPGSKRVLPLLFQQHEVFIVTAAMEFPTSFTAKFEWIKAHFPFVPERRIVFCGDKSIIAADYLIDDNASHFEKFSGQGLLFSAPHNIHELQYERLNDWHDIERRFIHQRRD